MFNLFSSRSVLGVDIGTASIKIVEIIKAKPKPNLKNYGVLKIREHLDMPNIAIQTNVLKIVEKETVELLKKLVKEAKFKTNEVIASIPSFSVFTTLLEMPKMPETDLKKTMSFQISQHIPLPATEVAIEWIKVGEKEDDNGQVKEQILLISIPNEIIEKYKNIFKMAGLKLKFLEMESLSLVRSLINGNLPAIIVDLGACSTNIATVDNGYLKANIFTDFAGVSLTSAIANGLNISIWRAEELKKQKGLTAMGGEYELSTLPQPLLDAIIEEVIRATNNFENAYEKKIERVILIGGGAKMLGIKEYFEKQIGVATVMGNSLFYLNYPPDFELLVKDLSPEFAVAIGLALKEF